MPCTGCPDDIRVKPIDRIIGKELNLIYIHRFAASVTNDELLGVAPNRPIGRELNVECLPAPLIARNGDRNSRKRLAGTSIGSL